MMGSDALTAGLAVESLTVGGDARNGRLLLVDPSPVYADVQRGDRSGRDIVPI